MIAVAAGIAAWLVLSVGVVTFGVPAYHAHKHARCLANIARLEVELGYREAPPLPVRIPAQAAERWQASAKLPAPRAYATKCLVGGCGRDAMLIRVNGQSVRAAYCKEHAP